MTKYYDDLVEARSKGETELLKFVIDAINDHKSTTMYKDASDAYEYFCKKNVTISKFKKVLYDLTGEAKPDLLSANYKLTNAFFPIFIRQENSFLLGNGITFNKNGTKEALGGDEFDKWIYNAGEYALWGGVSFVFLNLDHLDTFKVLEFAPLFGTEDGALHAGIRFWQIDNTKPLRATLYEEDGYTELIWRKNENDEMDGEILVPKTTYTQIRQESVADGVQLLPGRNYPGFPIVPMWANKEHQSELTGIRAKIDAYDLIESGFANDLDEASQIYWIIQNAGGMDEIDLKEFLDQIKRVKAAVIDEDNAHAEPHTIEIPYAARQAGLAELKDSLFRDAMALDTDRIQAGNITATAIRSAYENLNLKCDGYEYCVTECVKGLLALLNIDDAPTYHRNNTTNEAEVTSMIMQSSQYLDDETILKHLPFLNIDEVDDIMDRKEKEEDDRFKRFEEMKKKTGGEDETEAEGEEDEEPVNEKQQKQK